MAARELVVENDLAHVLDALDNVREQALLFLALQERTLKDLRNASTTVTDVNGSTTLTDDEMTYATHQSQLLSTASQLRGLHRRAIMSTRVTKQATTDARSEVDRLHLLLQNLIYEQRHLQGEIAACEGYEYVASDAIHCWLPMT